LLDRFGLSLEVKTPETLEARMEVVRRRDAFERDPRAFIKKWEKEDAKVRSRIVAARSLLPKVKVPEKTLQLAVQLCMSLGTDGLRGELTLIRAARAAASLDGVSKVDESHIRRVAPPALRHRLRRNPLDEAGSTVRVERAIEELFVA
jgi:magnesium chelatase subunit I